jgi:hypothetical protein
MSDAASFTEQELDDLDGDPVQAMWRTENESRTSAIGALDATDP